MYDNSVFERGSIWSRSWNFDDVVRLIKMMCFRIQITDVNFQTTVSALPR